MYTHKCTLHVNLLSLLWQHQDLLISLTWREFFIENIENRAEISMQHTIATLVQSYLFSNAFPKGPQCRICLGVKRIKLKKTIGCNHCDKTQRDLNPLRTRWGENLVTSYLEISSTVLHQETSSSSTCAKPRIMYIPSHELRDSYCNNLTGSIKPTKSGLANLSSFNTQHDVLVQSCTLARATR